MKQAREQQARVFPPSVYRQDLIFLRDVFPQIDRSFTGPRLALYQRAVAACLDQVETFHYASFAMAVSRCLAIADNAHTTTVLFRHLQCVPLRLYWFADGLSVIRTMEGPEDLVGSRVLQIAGRAIESWEDLLRPYIGGTQARLRTVGTFLLSCPEALASIDPSVPSHSLTMRYQVASGEERDCVLPPAPLPQNESIYPRQEPYTALVGPTLLPWRQALDRFEGVPLYLRDPEESVLLEWMPAIEAMYIRLRRTFSLGEKSLPDQLDDVLDEVELRGAAHAIVDLRFNDGGDFLLARKFCERLPGLLPAGGQLFIVVNEQTFSAGLIVAALLKYHGGRRASIVGDGPGDRGVFWAEGGVIELPGTGMPVRCATHFHDWEDGCRDPSICSWFNTLYCVGAGPLLPSLILRTTGLDYFAGYDPVLSYLEALLRHLELPLTPL